MKDYVTLKYWFEPEKGDERFYGEEKGWRTIRVTREEAINIISKGLLCRAKM